MRFFKENKQEKYDKERFYGAYIHDLRRYYEVPQKDLAKTLHVSKSTWSKMESGQQNMDYGMFHQCIDYFKKIDSDYDFNEKVSKLSEAEQWIDFCLQGFINLSYFDKLDEIKNYLDQEENKHSFAYFQYCLIEQFYDLFSNKGSMKAIEKLIDSGYFLDPYHLAILYDLNGIIEDFTIVSSIQVQIEHLKTALSYAKQSENIALIGLIEYHLNYHYSDVNDLIRAMDMVEQAKDHFQRSGCYRRLISVQVNEANIYMKMRIYSKAESIYKSLSIQREQIKNDFLESTLYENLAWCNFLQENDEKALDYALQAKEEGSTFPDVDIVLVFSNYRLKRFEKAREFAKSFLKKDSTSERAKFIKLFMHLVLQVLDSKTDPCDLADQIQSQLSSFQMVELEIPFYTLLVDFYQSEKKYEQALKYQGLLVNYLKFDFNNH